MRKVICPVSSFHNVDFREFSDEHELTHAESLLYFADLLLSDPSYNVRSGCEDVDYH